MKSLHLLFIALFVSACLFQAQAFEYDFADDDHLALLELSLSLEQDPDGTGSSTPTDPSLQQSTPTDSSLQQSTPTDSSQQSTPTDSAQQTTPSDSYSSTPSSAAPTSSLVDSQPAAPKAKKSDSSKKSSKKSSYTPVDPEKFAPPPLEAMPIPEVEPMNPLKDPSISKELGKAQQLYTTLLGQITREQDWARSVNEIIQNYQFKYSKVLKDVKSRKDKISRVRQLISLLKKAQLHKQLEGQLMKATEVLGSFSDSDKYGPVVDKVSELRSTLSKLAPSSIGSAVKEFDDKLVPIVTDVSLPDSNDAVKSLLTASPSADQK